MNLLTLWQTSRKGFLQIKLGLMNYVSGDPDTSVSRFPWVLRPPRKASSDRSKGLALASLPALRAASGESRGGRFRSHPAGCEFLGPPVNVNRPLLIGVRLSVQENAFPSQRTWTDWLEVEFSSCVRTGSEMRKPPRTALASRLCFSGGVQRDSERQERQGCLCGLPFLQGLKERDWSAQLPELAAVPRGAVSARFSADSPVRGKRRAGGKDLAWASSLVANTAPPLSAYRLTQPSYFSGRNDGVREG